MAVTSAERTTTAAPPDPPRPRRRRSFARSEQRAGAAFAVPGVALLLLFVIGPAVVSLVLAFTNARLISPTPPEFVGLENFQRAFTEDATFHRSMLNTFLFAAVVVPLQGGLGLVLALLVNQKLAGRNFFRTVYFLPVITSMVVVSLLWRFLYQEDGLINSALSMVTGGAWAGQAWLGEPLDGHGRHRGHERVAGRGLPHDHLARGAPDDPRGGLRGRGAGRVHAVAAVPAPDAAAAQADVRVRAHHHHDRCDEPVRAGEHHDGGGPVDSTSTIVLQIVQKGFQQQQMGYGAALSLIFFCIVLALALVQRRLTRDKD